MRSYGTSDIITIDSFLRVHLRIPWKVEKQTPTTKIQCVFNDIYFCDKFRKRYGINVLDNVRWTLLHTCAIFTKRQASMIIAFDKTNRENNREFWSNSWNFRTIPTRTFQWHWDTMFSSGSREHKIIPKIKTASKSLSAAIYQRKSIYTFFPNQNLARMIIKT